MDEELLHRLFRRLIKSADYYSDVLVVFGEDSSQARQAEIATTNALTLGSARITGSGFAPLKAPGSPNVAFTTAEPWFSCATA